MVHTISAAQDRKGKTDWTMDLPKIQYSAADDDSSFSNEGGDGDIDSDNSDAEEKRGHDEDDDSDNSDFEASSIAKVEKKYLK